MKRKGIWVASMFAVAVSFVAVNTASAFGDSWNWGNTWGSKSKRSDKPSRFSWGGFNPSFGGGGPNRWSMNKDRGGRGWDMPTPWGKGWDRWDGGYDPEGRWAPDARDRGRYYDPRDPYARAKRLPRPPQIRPEQFPKKPAEPATDLQPE